jgi:hypothetical protein
MVRSRTLLCCGLAALALAAGCGATHGKRDDLGSKEVALPASIPGYSVPLDLREFEVDSTDGGARGVFLKLSRLPSGVSSTSASGPARIVIDIQGPTGTESPEEQFPGGDSLVTHIGVSRQVGGLRIVLDLAVDDPPEFTVYPMADWVLVRIKPVSPHKHRWAHDAG